MLRSSPWPPSPKLPELRLSQESSPALPVPDHSGSRSPASPHLMPSGRTCQAQRHFHFPGPHAVSPLGAHWRGSSPRTPPFHPARRPLGSAGQIPGTCDGPRPRASAPSPLPAQSRPLRLRAPTGVIRQPASWARRSGSAQESRGSPRRWDCGSP